MDPENTFFKDKIWKYPISSYKYECASHKFHNVNGNGTDVSNHNSRWLYLKPHT